MHRSISVFSFSVKVVKGLMALLLTIGFLLAAAQLNLPNRFSKSPLLVKLGGSNVLNRDYNSFLGGPSIGGFYYCTLTFVKNIAKK